MIYQEKTIRSSTASSLKNETLFEIATARASNIEIVRFAINKTGDNKTDEKLIAAALKHFKRIKERGIIQFFATKASFDENSTEAKFLLNKYPELFSDNTANTNDSYLIYIKI